jgi:hypothetical protein
MGVVRTAIPAIHAGQRTQPALRAEVSPMKRLLFFVVVSSPLWAADAPTRQQVAACREDALKYCSAHIASRDAMRACMLAHQAQLSQACREAFAK